MRADINSSKSWIDRRKRKKKVSEIDCVEDERKEKSERK